MNMDTGNQILPRSWLVMYIVIGMTVKNCYGQTLTSKNESTCSGGKIILTCEVNGGSGGITVWSTSLTETGGCGNTIELRHNNFLPEGITRHCGIVTFESLTVNDSLHTSRAIISNVTSDLNGTCFTCEHDNGVATIGTDEYTILFTNVPSVPVVDLVPTYMYSEDGQHLIQLTTTIDIMPSLLPINSYELNFTISKDVHIPKTITSENCIHTEDTCCRTGINVTELLSDFNATDIVFIFLNVSATNSLGTGLASQYKIDFTSDNFVRISVQSGSIICEFQNEQDGSTNKSCSITYGQCGEQQNHTVQGSPDSDNPSIVQAQLNISDLSAYCYTVNASNDTYTVLIVGKIPSVGSMSTTTVAMENHGSTSMNTVAVLTTVLCIIVAVVVAIVVVVILILYRSRKLKKRMDIPHDGPSTGKVNLSGLALDIPTEVFSEDSDSSKLQGAKESKLEEVVSVSTFEDESKLKETANGDKLKEVASEDKLKEAANKSKLKEAANEDKLKEVANESKLKDEEEAASVSKLDEVDNGSKLKQGANKQPLAPESQSGLKRVDKSEYKLFTIEKDNGLLKFIKDEKRHMTFHRGCSYYEFSNETEDIDKECKIILIKKDSGEYFSGEKVHEMIGMVPTSGDKQEVKRPDELLKTFTVFVQDTGSGSRFLPKGSQLLVHLVECFDLEEIILSDRFFQFSVENDSELLTFIESQTVEEKPLTYERGNAFYEFSHESEDIPEDKEVLLMFVETKRLYTGKRAKILIGAPGKGIRNPYADKKMYRVFVQSNCTGNRHLDKGTSVLYEKNVKKHKRTPSNVSNYLEEVKDHYEVIGVDKDNSLRGFIEGKKKVFARKCAYYELVNDNEEDVESGKEVILMDEKGKLYRGQGAQRKIGAPGRDIKNPNISRYPRVFIQSHSPGHSVYVRQGTSVIYKDPEIEDLKEVSLEGFHRFDIKTTCELRQFVTKELGEFKRGRAYFQFTCSTEDIKNDKEVLLMDKNTGKLFGGTAASCKIGAPGIGIPRPDPDFQYTVFIQNNSCGSRCLIKGSTLLYCLKEDPVAAPS